VRHAPGPDEAAHLPGQRRVEDVLQQQPVRQDRVQHLGVHHDGLDRPVQHPVLDEEPRDVRPGGRHVVVVPADARVHLEEPERPVARVDLHVEVREPHVADAPQERRRLVEHPLLPGHDHRGRVPQAGGRVLLEQHVRRGQQRDRPAGVHVRRDRPHLGVVARHELLDDEPPAVARGAQRRPQRVELVRRADLEDLLLPRELDLLVVGAAGRLGDQRVADVHRDRRPGRVVREREVLHDRPGHGEAQVLGDLGERRLVRQPVHQVLAEERHHVVRLELRAVLHDDPDQPVRVRQQHQPLPGLLAGHLQHGVDQLARVVAVRDEPVVHDPRVGDRPEGRPAHDDRPDAVRLVERARQRVHADVGAEHDGLQVAQLPGARRRRRRAHASCSARSPDHSVWNVPSLSTRL
jgi:hypothetical protein